MKIKMMAIDLDGTLLKSDCTISERNINAIKSAEKAGIYIVPTTGRSYENSKRVLKKIKGIKYSINSNGALVCDIAENETIIHSEGITKCIATAILCESNMRDAFVEVYSEKDAYIEREKEKKLYCYHSNSFFCRQLLSTIIVKDNLETEIRKEGFIVNKFHVICKNHYIMKELYDTINTLEGISITVISETTLEVVKQGESKANGIKTLCQHLDFRMDEVVGIGDSMNDLEMLQVVGYPVAMGNAVPEIKKIAKYITEENVNDGVAKVIEKIVNNIR